MTDKELKSLQALLLFCKQQEIKLAQVRVGSYELVMAPELPFYDDPADEVPVGDYDYYKQKFGIDKAS